MELAVVFFIGAVFGVIFVLTVLRGNSVGSLRLDNSTDEPYLFLELKKSLDHIYSKKYVTLSVRIEDYLTQK